jgi:hypothetical protein
MGLGGQRHASAALPPGKTRYPLSRRLGWSKGRSGICVCEKAEIHDTYGRLDKRCALHEPFYNPAYYIIFTYGLQIVFIT